ncbi:MAG: hypothetical protein JWL62_97 [Hyphomicrobiales bacterium]|nr:hypothetical protein [Hyphomicrobiales bacterium]
MRRFFFDVRTPDAVVLDLIGDILPDAENALEEARKIACELACGTLRGDGATIPLVVLVRDELDVAVGSVNVLHAVTDALVGKTKGSDVPSA